MTYLFWALAAMVSYSFVFLFVKLAQRALPAFTVMTVAVFVLMSTTTLVTLLTGEWELSSFTSSHALFAYAAGSGSRGRSSGTSARSRRGR